MMLDEDESGKHAERLAITSTEEVEEAETALEAIIATFDPESQDIVRNAIWALVDASEIKGREEGIAAGLGIMACAAQELAELDAEEVAT